MIALNRSKFVDMAITLFVASVMATAMPAVMTPNLRREAAEGHERLMLRQQ